MNIPNIPPSSEPFVNDDGKITPIWYNVMNQLFVQLQGNVSQEGYKVPKQNTETITKLNTDESTSALIYNKETHKAMVNINGVFKEILTS